MQKSVLAEIVRSLSKKEARDIHKWLLSPAHNQRQDVIRLFEYMHKSLHDSDKAYEKERAWKFVYPEEPFDDARMRQVMYFLLKAVEEFLVFDDYANDPVRFNIALTRIYRNRNLSKAFRQAYRIGSDSLENQPLRNHFYLMHRYFLEQEEYEHLMTITQNAPVNLQETADALEQWFAAERLRISKDMLAHHRILQTIQYDYGLQNEILTYSERKKLLETPAVGVYYYAYQALTNPQDEDYFDELERCLHHEMEHFHRSEVRTLYLAALNYCVAKINQGRNDYASRAFELYKKGLETGILLENNLVSRYTFGNAVGAALKIREFGWAEKFIHDFEHHLDEKHRKSIVNFNLSRVYFEKGDYDKAQRLLFDFDYDDMLLNIIAKTMLLKIYYEQGEFDALESLLESMRIYLQRKEALDPTRKSAYKNLISLMKKLLNLNPYSKTQTERMRTLVESTEPLMEREWLLRQLEGNRR